MSGFVFFDRLLFGGFAGGGFLFEFGFSGFEFTAGEGAGIAGVEVESQDDPNAPIYNLAGQRVSKDAKGILIQNGKKFIRK